VLILVKLLVILLHNCNFIDSFLISNKMNMNIIWTINLRNFLLHELKID